MCRYDASVGAPPPPDEPRPALDYGTGVLQSRIGTLLGEAQIILNELAQRADIVELASDAIILLEMESRLVLEWNPGAERLYGWTRAEALGKALEALLFPTPELGVQAEHMLQQLLEADFWEGESQLRRRDGTLLTVRTRLNLRRMPYGRLLVLSVSHDNTLELEANEQRVARERAEAALRARDDFLSIAAHELKTPLTSLAGFAQLLESEFDSVAPNAARIRRALKAILAQSVRLNRLSTQLLDLSRIRAGTPDALKLERTNVSLLVSNTCSMARSRWPTLTLVADVPAQVECSLDAGRIEQVLTNLIENACKFAPNGPIEISLERLPDTLEIAVRDHGPGVPSELRDVIFERAFQVNAKHSGTGLGLGLYICRQLVDLHGGRIWVEPRLDKQPGARFVLSLPLNLP